jgi:mannosyltransferase
VTDVVLRPAEQAPEPAHRRSAARPDRAGQLFKIFLGLAVAAAVIIRFTATQALWLDEAQSVAISRLPLTGSGTTLFDGLRQDGSPPLYYLILHVWMELFGSGTTAVRALSALLNIVAAGPLFLLARRVVGPLAARVTVLLYLTSPFALYFASETRMYSLIVLLAACGGLALERVLHAPSARSVLALAVCAGLVALTHYWSLYLLLTIGLWMVLVMIRPRPGWGLRGPAAAFGGLCGGAVIFSLWLPEFVYQMHHTGTPWGDPASFAAVAHAYGQWAGGPTTLGRLLLLLITGLAAAGLAGEAIDGRYISVDLRGREPGRTLFFLATLTLVIAVAAGQLVGNAWADRYTATAFVPFLLVIGLGATRLVNPRVFRAVVALAAVIGLVAGAQEVWKPRTQAGQAGSVLSRLSQPGDVLLVCPDQLGPGLSRTVPSWLKVHVVPTYGPPARVDWVDYKARNLAANGAAIADRALAEAGPGHTVFMAGSGSYQTFEALCTEVRGELQNRRPDADEVMKQADPAQVTSETYSLLRFRP